ncbi:hypothetical protein [Paraburkholderia sacchari]|uniref:hypothetical protein n=1 Tax=Paraburkholderia sacchari TaxID=159450 RepID=UPI003D984FE3
MRHAIKWLDEPEPHNYPAASSFLCLNYLHDAPGIVWRLKDVTLSSFKAKDIVRAADIALLDASNHHVERNLEKIRKGEPLSPVLLVVRPGKKLLIADGYHRICAVYRHDEDAEIRCKLVGDAP